MNNLDKKDRELLYLLDVNARASLSQLAKKTSMSKQVVKYRINRLEKSGFIKGYYAMIDHSRLGFISFRIYLKFRNINPKKHNIILNYLKKQKPVWAIVNILGKWDIALGVGVGDIYNFYDFWENFLSKYIKNIKDYAISIYSPIYHFTSSYLVDKKDTSKQRILGGKGKAEFDKIDLKILNELSKNARISLVEISEKINMTAEAIAKRIKKLEKKEIIQGYRAMIDIEKLGYNFYKTEIRLSKFQSINKLMDFCHSHPNIYQIDKTIGGETLEIEFHVKTLRQMHEIIKQIQSLFPNTIESWDYITLREQEHVTYMPQV
jgi:DNA-binding Lrp family transcriptional regulator